MAAVMIMKKDKPLLVRMSAEDRKVLARLARHWKVTQAEAIRLAVKRAAA